MTAPAAIAGRIAPPYGRPLSNNDYATLSLSWINKQLADESMLRRVDESEGREVIGQKGKRECAGIVFPYYWPGEPHPFSYRVRRDRPNHEYDKDGKVKTKAKYLGSPKSGNHLYIPPGVTVEQLNDVTVPIALVEGEKKALALWRLAKYEAEHPRFIPVAIPGVWSWRGVIGKTGGPNGERLDVKGPIPDLNRIQWNGRNVFIVFDTNVHTNDSVRWARKGICRELASRGAKPKLVNLPPDCGVNGIDDLLAKWGPEKVLKLFDAASPGPSVEAALPPQFQSKPEGLFRVTSNGEQLKRVQLTNYEALIITNILLDDGVETKREFEIEAELMGSRQRFTIPASEFGRMDWPIEQLGSGAITFPNQRDYARTAIQSLSLTAGHQCIFTHTGWRQVGGNWVFLHAGGAIGASGPVPDVHVRLAGAMSRYEMRLPHSAEELAAAVRASPRLLELGPPEISFPLLAATYRAVFGEADYSVHLAGETGAFKSELAALHQQHFGASMNRVNLPGSWSSTGNSLEALAFYAKDALFVIDDFAPQGSGADVARYHAAADRVFRAAGNHAGRARLDSSAKLREPKPPRASILSTGEDIPRGHSVRARLLLLELAKGTINSTDLAECQRDGQGGRYAEAMGSFVQRLADRHDEAWAMLARKVSRYRAIALNNPAHARTPEIVANLQAGFEMFLEFAVACGVIDSAERDNLAARCWEALRTAAAAQTKHQMAAEPAGRFLALVKSALSSGRAHLGAPRR